jgi:hypothetical protein
MGRPSAAAYLSCVLRVHRSATRGRTRADSAIQQRLNRDGNFSQSNRRLILLVETNLFIAIADFPVRHASSPEDTLKLLQITRQRALHTSARNKHQHSSNVGIAYALGLLASKQCQVSTRSITALKSW